MGLMRRLPRMKKGDQPSAAAWNTLVDMVYAMQLGSVSPPLKATNTQSGVCLSIDVPPAGALRYKVTNIDYLPTQGYVTAKTMATDANNTDDPTGEDTDILCCMGHPVDGIMFALYCDNGVGKTNNTSQQIHYIEHPWWSPSLVAHQVVKTMDDTGVLVIDSNMLE